MKRGNVVLPRFGWNGPERMPGDEIKSKSEGRHGRGGDAEDEAEDARELQGIAHGVLGFRLLFKWGFIAEVRGGSGTLI
ncbi:MAG: hypothetical protein JWL81_1106 [Verrucomicrobiales bacterium]|nr:hypothetical protein [Verrucomicrobiales bacterium]